MEDTTEHFFGKKKMYLQQMRTEKAKQEKLEKQAKWATRLVQLNDQKKQCCKRQMH
jgi:hypothetical protein